MRCKLIILTLLFINSIAYSYVKYTIPVDSYHVLRLSETFISGEMGKREITGQNDGVHIVKYMKATGLSGYKGYPYCAAGQAWGIRKAVDSLKANRPFKYSAVANYYFDYAKKHGEKIANPTPARHDYVIWKNPNNYTGHIERVFEVVDDYTVYTYAFNTSNGKTGSQREGNGNYIRKRNLKSFLGRLRIRGLVGWNYPRLNNYFCNYK